MPKVYTYNAEFNPISFTDRVAPALLYKEEYDKQQEAYYKYLEDASTLADLKDSEIDQDSYKIYTDHMANIERLGEILETQGLRGGEARELALQIKRDQSSRIDPLVTKLGIRSKLIEKQRDGQLKDNNLIYDKYYDTIPISQIDASSTFRPIHLDKDVYEPSFNAAVSGYNTVGIDAFDYNKIKESVGYDQLTPQDQKRIDDMILSARYNGLSAYNEYIDKRTTDRLRRTGTGSNGEHKTRTIMGLNGEAVVVNLGKDDEPDTIKGFDGKSRVVKYPDMTGMTKDQRAEAITAARLRAFYGNNDYVGSATLHGKLPIHIFSNGKKRYILNKDGKMAEIKYTGPDRDEAGFDRNYYKSIIQAYYGRDFSFLNGTQSLDGPILPSTPNEKAQNIDSMTVKTKPFDPEDPNNPTDEQYIRNHQDIKLNSLNEVLSTDKIDGEGDILLEHQNKSGGYDADFWNAFFELGGYVLLKPRVPNNKNKRGDNDIWGYDVKLVFTPDRDYLNQVANSGSSSRNGGGID